MTRKERISKATRELIKILAMSQKKHPRQIQDEMLANLEKRKPPYSPGKNQASQHSYV